MSKKKLSKKKNIWFIVGIKLIIILFLGLSYFYLNSSFSNSINLLAVSEDSKGDIFSGSLIKLNLEIKPGSGKTFVNLKTIEEIDTQISIINSKKIACELFELDCDSYDFYYEFDGAALILKGPSASSAIAIITAKTVNKQKIDKKSVITGSLNSGGIIGNVGGVDKKIEIAKENGFEKVLIPVFSKYNKSKYEDEMDIKIVPVMNVIEAYNAFNGDDFQIKETQLDKSRYLELMSTLGESMCERSRDIRSQINFDFNISNSSLKNYFEQANKSYESAMESYDINNYYSMGSFCYNANINYRIINEINKNESMEEIDKKLGLLEAEINLKFVEISSKSYKKNIQTNNDFYTYLVLFDRIEEAREFIKEAKKLDADEKSKNDIIDIIMNESNNKSLEVNEMDIKSEVDINKKEKNIYYSFAIERFYTVKLWEEFMSHSGLKIKFNDELIEESCIKISREISIKGELLRNYGISFFEEDLKKQTQLSSDLGNKYSCIYTGLENLGRFNAVLNSVGIDGNSTKDYTSKMINYSKIRMTHVNSDGNFPLIPQIYSEYAEDLLRINDTGSAMLYTNYALSYADINIYLEEDKNKKGYFNQVLKDLFENKVFMIAVLILLAFSGI
ncbi:MAG: hypothetical protein KC589_01115 [Nanoarchaeota archaeon]|nr:hypothetical protein [Nanoarchaeota archaeon]